MIGEELGNYRVLAPIGKGGMASVFIGEHKLLQSRVAIKVLQRRHLDNPAIERRFFNEAKVIAAIKHANIVEIYDFGRADNGAAYIVMELLEGETLRQRIRQGVMPERQSIIFARQLAAALAAAHNEGVIHRDLKPDNVFIIEDEEVELGERIKLLDFGIAKRFQNLGPASEQTATGILVGTPAYMSPEQCKGMGNIDGRSDIYSLGVVLYRMVTNQLPFEAGGTGELIGKHLYIQPPPPRELNPEISSALDDIVMRCLQKEPDDRFASMSDLVSALSEANAATAIDAVQLDDDLDADSAIDTINNAAPVGARAEAPTEISPVPAAVPAGATAPSAVHRVASPVAIEEISATTLRTATGEKVSPLYTDPMAIRSARGWGFYAAIGATAALLIGVVAMTAGGGSSAGQSAAPAAIGEVTDAESEAAAEPDDGDGDGEVSAAKGTDETSSARDADSGGDNAAAAAAAAEQVEAERLAAARAAADREAADREAAEREAAAREAAEEREAAAREAAAAKAKRDAEKKAKRLAAEAEARRKAKARSDEAKRKADRQRKAELDARRRADRRQAERAAARRRAKEKRKRDEAQKQKNKKVDLVY